MYINHWVFVPEWSEEFCFGKADGEEVDLPHNVKEVPYHSINEKDYQMVCGYRTTIQVNEDLSHKKALLHFQGAGHIATVYLDGQEIGEHKGGYTAFTLDITTLVSDQKEHLLAVKLDTTENPTIPPFGFVIDYLTYGGLYREVSLDIVDEVYVDDVFVYTPRLSSANILISTNEPTDKEKIIRIYDQDHSLIREEKTKETFLSLSFDGVKVWNTEHPYLYTLDVSLEGNQSKYETHFGFRTAEFKEDGFYLNGEKVFIRGLNRHQSYPYIGYAAPKSLQEEDARILKEELGLNAVRTSHYPQSQYFIDACDRLGLLVFTEIPGWQHIGDQEWKNAAMDMTKEMVLQYRNHPSIILWGVRINESQDDDAFYTITNHIAHEFDPSRQTSGVRYFENSHLLEDVYGYNDFSHNGTNPGVKPKKDVTKENKPLMITESNGHMFPTKPYDSWEKRQEHALRHARVLNDAMADGNHVGCFQWCMFDYPTHKDFGSGDRICYHGVMDGFRNPKLAASLYASQQDQTPILEVGSTMDIGDYPGGLIGKVYVFTNLDTVKLYKNGDFVTDLSLAEFTSLPHNPKVVDDTIGELLKTKEGFTGTKEKLIHQTLQSAAINGVNNMPPKDMAKMGYVMLRYGMKYSDGVELFGKYVGNWGGESTVWRFDGIKDGEVVLSKTLAQSNNLHLEVKVSSTKLKETSSYDMALVRIQVLDEYGNLAPYHQIPVTFEVEGDIELVGPSVATLEGGSTGTYVRNKPNGKGQGTLTIKANGLESKTIVFELEG